MQSARRLCARWRRRSAPAPTIEATTVAVRPPRRRHRPSHGPCSRSAASIRRWSIRDPRKYGLRFTIAAPRPGGCSALCARPDSAGLCRDMPSFARVPCADYSNPMSMNIQTIARGKPPARTSARSPVSQRPGQFEPAHEITSAKTPPPSTSLAPHQPTWPF